MLRLFYARSKHMMRNLSGLTDAELVKMTIGGDKDAYCELVVRHENAVLMSAGAIVGNALREDAAQTAFVTAWLKLNTLREPEKFKAWVCMIAKNCARNMADRTDVFLPLDQIEWEYISEHDSGSSFHGNAPLFDDDADSLREKLDELPEKIRRAVSLYYLEGYSIAEISGIMCSPRGTVKWMLHKGRELLRKELCKMANDSTTLVERVMRQMKEFELLLLNDSKSGIEDAFSNLLAEVESLDDSQDKTSLIAQVMQKKQWYIDSGDDHSETLERMKNAAEASHNDDVMMTVAASEHENYSGEELINLMKNVQIPFFEKENYPKTLGYIWFWLGNEYMQQREYENALDAFEHASSVLPAENEFYANAISAKNNLRLIMNKLSKIEGVQYEVNSISELYLIDNGNMRMASQPGCTWDNENCTLKVFVDNPIEMLFVFPNICGCDRYFLKTDLAPGESYVGSLKNKLTRDPGKHTVETPCGTFEDCELWIIERGDADRNQAIMYSDRYEHYFKPGVGLVKQTIYDHGFVSTAELIGYTTAPDTVLPGHPIPIHTGNRWYYRRRKPENAGQVFECDIAVETVYTDPERVTFAYTSSIVQYPDSYDGGRETDYREYEDH